MKDLIKNGVLIVLAIGVIYLIYLRERTPTGTNTVIQYDTIPGEVQIIYDTVYIEIGNSQYITKYVKAYDTIYVDSSEITVYLDSIVNDSIRFWQDILIDGQIYEWHQRYEPIFSIRETQTEKPIYIKSYEYKRELFLSGFLSGNMETFSPGVSLDYVNKKRNLYGVSIQYLNGKPLYGFRIGGQIRFR